MGTLTVDNLNLKGSGSVSSLGRILQVVQTAKTDTFTSSSSSFTDITGLSVSITPSSASSKVMVIVETNTSTASGNNAILRLLRGSTVILQGPNQASGSEPGGEGFSSANGPGAIQFAGAYNWSFLDSPSTTSATTYKTQFANNQSSASPTIFINSLSSNSGEDGVSTITLFEVTT